MSNYLSKLFCIYTIQLHVSLPANDKCYNDDDDHNRNLSRLSLLQNKFLRFVIQSFCHICLMPTIHVCDFFAAYHPAITSTGSNEKCRCLLGCKEKKRKFIK